MEQFIERVTWEQVNDYLNKIVKNASTIGCTGVYGIPRGGLVLAAWLSHKLYVPLLSAPSPNCIIIDDICDSGESLMHYSKQTSTIGAENRKEYFITTMYHRHNELGICPDYYYALKGDKWVVFPWEE